MSCVLCDQFIWERGAVVWGRAICKDCAGAVNEQFRDKATSYDEGFEDGFDAGFEARTVESVERKLREARERRKKVPA